MNMRQLLKIIASGKDSGKQFKSDLANANALAIEAADSIRDLSLYSIDRK
jgi:hypothetical protein